MVMFEPGVKLNPWETLIADTVHFGSKFPNDCISGRTFRGECKTHLRLHHYLGSQDRLKSAEQARHVFDDSPYKLKLQHYY